MSLRTLARPAILAPVACGLLLCLGCSGGPVTVPPPPTELVGVWSLTLSGPREDNLTTPASPLTMVIQADGVVIFSNEPASPYELRMLQSLTEPTEDGFRTATAGFISEGGAVTQISILLMEDDMVLQIQDNTNIGDAQRVKRFEKQV